MPRASLLGGCVAWVIRNQGRLGSVAPATAIGAMRPLRSTPKTVAVPAKAGAQTGARERVFASFGSFLTEQYDGRPRSGSKPDESRCGRTWNLHKLAAAYAGRSGTGSLKARCWCTRTASILRAALFSIALAVAGLRLTGGERRPLKAMADSGRVMGMPEVRLLGLLAPANPAMGCFECGSALWTTPHGPTQQSIFGFGGSNHGLRYQRWPSISVGIRFARSVAATPGMGSSAGADPMAPIGPLAGNRPKSTSAPPSPWSPASPSASSSSMSARDRVNRMTPVGGRKQRGALERRHVSIAGRASARRERGSKISTCPRQS
jgi:hypothetical protein